MPAVYDEFVAIGDQLERHYKDVQDLEFTIERGKLYMLQTRSAKRTAAAAVKIAVDMVGEGLIDKREAVSRIEPSQVDQLLRDQFEPAARKAAKKIAERPQRLARRRRRAGRLPLPDRGRVGRQRRDGRPRPRGDLPGRLPGHGRLPGDPDRQGRRDLPRGDRRPPDRQALRGRLARSSHVDADAKTARSSVTGLEIHEGDWISLDGSTGEVFLGALPTVSARFEDQPELQTVLGWADEIRRLEIWTNADKPEEAAQARSYGAQGIGLCRTEHMFREGERLEIVRGAILVANAATRAKAKVAAGEALDADEAAIVAQFDAAMDKLEVLQQGDFEGILAAMSGLPVVVRLIDPPLHEFLPNLEEQLVKVTKAGDAATAEDRELLATIKSMHEQNPMLGLRGCRLGLMIPDFVKIQTRAILNAAVAVKRAGKDPRPEIMIPLVGHVNELIATRALLDAEAEAVVARAGETIDFKFGTMIEIPRAVWVADQIAEHAEFFSFGTNDLTQMTFGYSRDDAEGGFLLKYVEDGILPENPFQTLDDVIADEMQMAVDKGRAARPGPQGRHLRRAWRRPGVDPQVREDRPQLRLLLALPHPGGAARGGAGGDVRRRVPRQVAPGARGRDPPSPVMRGAPSSGPLAISPGRSPKVRLRSGSNGSRPAGPRGPVRSGAGDTTSAGVAWHGAN